MDRSTLLKKISARLGTRRLVWFGTRGDDVEPATELAQLEASYSLISPLRTRSSLDSSSLEDLTSRRVDLDAYDIDDELRTEAVAELRSLLLRSLARPSVLFTYRPTTFLSAVSFARQDRCEYLGMFRGHQAAFEHKPWLESAVASLGIPHIPWRYVADIEQVDAKGLLAGGELMLRPSRTSGGVGLERVATPAELEALWPSEEEAYVSVAPYLADGLPVNVGAVVWHDGVTIHPASLQLIGVPGCTTRPFGYCGNDFAAVHDLDPETLRNIDELTAAIGGRLRELGFLGAFGVDYLVKDGVPIFTEVNPRFQGSTHLSCQLSMEAEESCLLIEHLAAFLGISAPTSRRQRDFREAGNLSHIVVHNVEPEVRSVDPGPVLDAARRMSSFCRSDVATSPLLRTEPGATIARVTFRSSVTTTGFELQEPWRSWVDASEGDDTGDGSTRTLLDMTEEGGRPW